MGLLEHQTEDCFPTDSGKVDMIQVDETENDHFLQGVDEDLAWGESVLVVVVQTLEERYAWAVEQPWVVGLAWEVDQEWVEAQ